MNGREWSKGQRCERTRTSAGRVEPPSDSIQWEEAVQTDGNDYTIFGSLRRRRYARTAGWEVTGNRIAYEMYEPALVVLQLKEKIRMYFPVRNIAVEDRKDDDNPCHAALGGIPPAAWSSLDAVDLAAEFGTPALLQRSRGFVAGRWACFALFDLDSAATIVSLDARSAYDTISRTVFLRKRHAVARHSFARLWYGQQSRYFRWDAALDVVTSSIGTWAGVAANLGKTRVYSRDGRHEAMMLQLAMPLDPDPEYYDVRDRFQFAKKYRNKTGTWWANRLDAFIDGKHFQVYRNSKERLRAAQHSTYGAYRRPGQGLCGGYVKPKAGNLRHNTGAKGVLLHVGIGKAKAVTVHEVVDGRWSGQAAASFYRVLARDLAKVSPGKRKFTILEDNDPTGYKSAKGISAKRAAGLNVFQIPKRSPDLSVLDYAIWAEVNKRLRKQESKWPKGKKETRVSYIKRLKLTIRSLPKEFLLSSIKDMARRCQRLYEAKGYFFEEGGQD
ncbi:unnamed protein product [Symbiodinium microadriaticum]|nr:unnamed protein product [Symbiodinium microadriaticum]CAE7350673.1 unnamed protein product [Symbiodinium sp. KB8]